MVPNRRALLATFLLLVLAVPASAYRVYHYNVPEVAPVKPEPVGQLPEVVNESSGLDRGELYPDVFWTLNDSGGAATLYPVTATGEDIRTEWAIRNDVAYEGLPVAGADNIDWEALTADDAGNLIIGAFGNNGNARRDLALFVVPEPNPRATWRTRVVRTIFFRYPDQTAFPPENRNFDCEALFHAHGRPYLISKHRSDDRANLYRLDRDEPGVVHPLTKLDGFVAISDVTGADATADGAWLVVLTYDYLWLFHQPDGTDNWFGGEAWVLPVDLRQCEAVCWDGPDRIVVSNEQRDLFAFTRDDFLPAPPVE